MSTKQLEKKEEKVEKRPSANSGAGSFSMPPVTIVENDDCVTVQADLPGVSKERVSLHCEQDTLTLEGELSVELNPGEETTALQAELRTPRFRRSFLIGNELDTQNIKAEMADGVLTIRIPKHPSARPHKIQIS